MLYLKRVYIILEYTKLQLHALCWLHFIVWKLRSDQTKPILNVTRKWTTRKQWHKNDDT